MNVIPIKTEYIQANEGYSKIIDAVKDICQDNDYLIISETPISTAEGNLLDESYYNPGLLAIFLAEFWSKYFWGYILCPLFGCKERTKKNLRKMPKEARNHKQLILKEYGIKYALQPTAEAGVDLSNVPDQFVSLLPENPMKSAKNIQYEIKKITNKTVHVVIIDTDGTYQFHNTKYTTLPIAIQGIKSGTGVFGFMLRKFSKKLGPTVLASTIDLDVNKLIELGNIAEKCEIKSNNDFFETIYDMKSTFNSNFNDISPEMLNNVIHIPAVLIKNE